MFIAIGLLLVVAGVVIYATANKTIRRLEVEDNFGAERLNANGRRLAGGMSVLAGLVLAVTYFLQ